MSNRVTYWGSGKQSRNIFTVQLWKFRLELWKDLKSPKALVETPEERKKRLSDHWEDL